LFCGALLVFSFFDHCIACHSSIYGFWLLERYLQTFLMVHWHKVVFNAPHLPDYIGKCKSYYSKTSLNWTLNKTESCLNWTLNKTKSCLNWTLNKTESCLNQSKLIPE
jgi:hypothetical protein